MKNKIFNAIQKGLSNVLVFDDNDSSISYQKTKTANEIEFPKVSLYNLYDIFKENNDSIFNYNTCDCLTLILDNNQEISLHEYKISDTPVFLKISNDTLKSQDNEIIIACANNHYASLDGMQIKTESIQTLPDSLLIKNKHDAIYDFDGNMKYQKMQNQIILHNKHSNLNSLVFSPAIYYCSNLNIALPNYEGYLPSIGQLYCISKYLDMINYIFKSIGFDVLNLNQNVWWSSSEYSKANTWFLNHNDISYGSVEIYRFNVLPLLRKNKQNENNGK